MMTETSDLKTPTSPLAVPRRLAFSRYLVLLAVIVAVVGQYVLVRIRPGSPVEGKMQAIGGALLILGAVAFGIAVRIDPTFESCARRPQAETASPARRATMWVPVLAASILLALAAILLFSQRGESPIVVGLWMGSILLLLVSQFRRVRPHWPRIPREGWCYLALLTIVLLASLLTRTYQLASLPYNVDGDFAEVGNQARALATGQQQQIFGYGWAAIPMLGYLPAWTTMLLFGTGLVGLNMSGVMEGVLIILGVYLLGREFFNPRAGLFAAATLAVSYTHLAASRQSSYIDPAFALLFAVYFLSIGLRKDQGWEVVLSGLLTALCLEMYYSGRLIVPFAGIALLYGIIFHRSWILARWKALGIWSAAVLIALGPMLIIFARSPGSFNEHMKQVFILSPPMISHMEGVFGVNTVSEMLLQQVRHTVLLFHYYPDKGTQFALQLPFLDPFLGVLFALGVGYMLFNWRRLGAWLALSWTLLGIVLGCLLTGNPPFWPRLMILLPAMGLICGVALDLLYTHLESDLNFSSSLVKIGLPLVIGMALVGLGIRNWNAYVKAKGTYATPRTRISYYLAGQPSSARAYLVSKEFAYDDREFNFLIPGRLAANLTPEQAEAAITPVGSPTLLIVTPEETDVIQNFQGRYPGGPMIGNSPGETAFYVFQLP